MSISISGIKCVDCVTKKPLLLSSFLVSYEVSWQTNSQDPDQPHSEELTDQDPTIYHAAYVMLQGLVHDSDLFSYALNSK